MDEALYLLILLVLSGFFSGSETAMTALSRVRAESLAKDGRPGAHALWRLKQEPNRMLIILLIGNNIVNVGASAMATVIATERFGRLGPGIAVGVLTLLILVFGEITPKSFAIRHAERFSLLAAPIIAVIGKVLGPVVWAFERFIRWLQRSDGRPAAPRVTATDLVALVAHGAASGTIDHHERAFIERVFAFDELHVQDVMTPRHQVFSLDGGRTVREILPEVIAQSHSRVPVYCDDRDDIVKVLYLRDVLAAVAEGKLETPIIDIARDALFVPETRTLTQLFATLRAHNVHVAMVVDEYGAFEGVVSLEDLLEELVGEIYDETDEPHEPVREVAPDEISVDGGTELRLVAERFALDVVALGGKPTDTVSLWLLNEVGRIPRVDETFELDGLVIKVEDATKRRIRRLRIRCPAPAATAPADA